MYFTRRDQKIVTYGFWTLASLSVLGLWKLVDLAIWVSYHTNISWR